MIPHHYFNKKLKYQISDDKVKIYGETNLGEYNIVLEFPIEAIDLLYKGIHKDV